MTKESAGHWAAWCSHTLWCHLYDCCVPRGIRIIFNSMPSFPCIIPTLACLLACVWHQEGRTIILVRRCSGRWSPRRSSALYRCLPRRRRVCDNGCWLQWSCTAIRHRMWIIMTRSCVCPSPPWGSLRVSAWCASRAHGSLGTTCSDPRDLWRGPTGWSGTSWNRRSRFLWGTVWRWIVSLNANWDGDFHSYNNVKGGLDWLHYNK